MEFKNLGKVSSLKTIKIKEKNYQIYSLKSLYKEYPSLKQIPFSLKVLLENLLRKFDGSKITDKDIEFLASWTKGTSVKKSISRTLKFSETKGMGGGGCKTKDDNRCGEKIT